MALNPLVLSLSKDPKTARCAAPIIIPAKAEAEVHSLALEEREGQTRP